MLQIRTIAIIAEGIPENKTKILIHEAQKRGVVIIGPATVGGIKPGCFKIGNTGGMVDNILDSKLYRPGRYVRMHVSVYVASVYVYVCMCVCVMYSLHNSLPCLSLTV